MFRTTLCSLSILSLATITYAQRLNIDIGSVRGVPPSTYGGAFGQPGVWNQISYLMTTDLVDLAGGTTAATLTFDAGANTGGASSCSGNANEALVGDNFFYSAFTKSVTISNLLNGTYEVALYAPANGVVSTGSMTVNGVGVSNLVGSCSPVSGTDWASVTVSVTTGSLRITASAEGSYGLAGIQLRPMAVPVELLSFTIE